LLLLHVECVVASVRGACRAELTAAKLQPARHVQRDSRLCLGVDRPHRVCLCTIECTSPSGVIVSKFVFFLIICNSEISTRKETALYSIWCHKLPTLLAEVTPFFHHLTFLDWFFYIYFSTFAERECVYMRYNYIIHLYSISTFVYWFQRQYWGRAPILNVPLS